jgi:hypothetical protein
MNSPAFNSPGQGGAFFNGRAPPVWSPPISMPWIISIVLLVISVNLDSLPPAIPAAVNHPIGFFLSLLFALYAYDMGFPQTAFASLFFILMTWSQKQHARNEEGFSPSGTIDWVTNGKRWFVEVVLKEKPLAIQERPTNTYPIQGDNSVPSS